MGRLFGTDGIRGVANRELTPELALRLGRAHGYRAARETPRPRLVVGRDTRLSGEMLEFAYAAGAMSAGADVLRAGVLPTPGVAWVIRELGAAGGAVISASHNPIEDNGIKLFDRQGFKLEDTEEEELEDLMEGRLPLPEGDALGRDQPAGEEAEERYAAHLEGIGGDLSGLTVVLDCAYGAAWRVAPRVFRRLGAEVLALHDAPDGSRINRGCGSTAPARLQRAVMETGADLGLAFDGDADRCIAVDSRGEVVDGDPMLLIFARWLRRQDRLPGGLVVATVMSNLGLELALRREGLELARTPVGDRYVLELLRERGGVLGGEPSGHILLLEHSTTGDGLLTGLLLAAIVRREGRPLAELAGDLERVPQRLVNVPVRHKERLARDAEIAAALRRTEERLADRGRVLVRPSGTEPLIRVMAECRDAEELEEVVGSLSELIRRRLG